MSMQEWDLHVTRCLDHAARWHGDAPVACAGSAGGGSTWARVRERALALARALVARGVRRGQHVATMSFNSERHMMAWWAIMGCGAVVHTLNPRYFVSQLADIVHAAQDRVFFVDEHCAPEMAALQAELEKRGGPCGDLLARGVAMVDGAAGERAVTEAGVRGQLETFEALVAAELGGSYSWFGGLPFDERSPCGLSFTSGTTGAPKGVVYTHRSNFLHAMSELGADSLHLSATDTVLCGAAMYHANAWGLVFSCPLAGAGVVLPGRDVSGPALVSLARVHGATLMTGVPTLYIDILAHLDSGKAGKDPLRTLKRAIVGGAAPAASVIEAFEERYGVTLVQAWGMTEMGPLGTNFALKRGVAPTTRAERTAYMMKAGRTQWINDMKVSAHDSDRELPRDGKTIGRLMVNGPSVIQTYFKSTSRSSVHDPRLDDVLDPQGFFDTGDIATIDSHGFVSIVDRNKDVIKSGGEWISSIDVENLALSAPGVAEACCVGVPHPQYDERPALCVVCKPGASVSAAAVLAVYHGRVPKWWIPDEVIFVDAIPRTATGKMSKRELRKEIADGKHDKGRRVRAKL